MIYYVLAAIAIVAVIAAVWAVARDSSSGKKKRNEPGTIQWIFTPEYKRAGIRGENSAATAIATILREGDHLFTNVPIQYDGKTAELDVVIVNTCGVFIIEVKNYSGYIVGGEDDYEWRKYKTTYAGNTYEKTVKNPIKQVRRQIYLLAHYLDYYGLRVWVKGYAILLQGNSPVTSEYVLTSLDDVDRAIHKTDRRGLNLETVEKRAELFS